MSAKKENDCILFAVKDTGCGIDPKKIDRIFEPFANLESTRHQDLGFGLNLPRARVIAMLHSWEIKGWSRRTGKGTGFVVKIQDPAVQKE